MFGRLILANKATSLMLVAITAVFLWGHYWRSEAQRQGEVVSSLTGQLAVANNTNLVANAAMKEQSAKVKQISADCKARNAIIVKEAPVQNVPVRNTSTPIQRAFNNAMMGIYD